MQKIMKSSILVLVLGLGMVFGATALAAAPTASTTSATNITSSSMDFNGTYSTSATGVIATWFEYATTYSDVNTGNGTSVGYKNQTSASGSFSATSPALSSSTIYYYRMAVSQGSQIGYGNILYGQTSATTVVNSPAPTASTTTATNVDSSS